MAAATSSALTSRPIGCLAASAARSAAGSAACPSRRPTQGVSAVPGFTQFTRMPSGKWSAAMASVRDSTAPLVAEYSARCGKPAVAAMEQVLTIAACSDWRKAPQRRAGDLDHADDIHVEHLVPLIVCRATVPTAPIPALFTRMSMPPS